MSLFIAREQWTVSVNYSLSLDQMIAAGHFKSVDRNYSATAFPIKGEGTKSLLIRLVGIEAKSGDIATDEVLNSMKLHAVRPAVLEELLALAAGAPDARLDRRVTALGTIWRDPDGLVYVPECNFAKSRRLHLHPIRREPWWHAMDDCFACVPL